jgi:phosphate:Na+ symporter
LSGTELLLTLAGGVTLLLWGTRMARTGFLRAFGAELRAILGAGTSNRLRAAATGLASASLLQSSTAAALLAASFASAGLLDVSAGLAIMLGADIGSALVAQVFTFGVSELWPALMFAGFVMHSVFEKRSSRAKQYGRIVIGLALMLLALKLISGAAADLRDSQIIARVLGALEGEPVLAVLVAMALTWIAHSSLAVVLLVASLGAAGVLAAPLALALVLGVNAGAAIPAVVITLSEPAEARRIAIGNMFFRFAGVIAAVPLLPLIVVAMSAFGHDAGRQAMTFHLAFNIGLLLVFIGLTGPVARLTAWLIPGERPDADPGRPRYLDESAKDLPSVALSLAARETLHMGDIVETMLRRSMEALETGDARLCGEIQDMDDQVDSLYEAIKLYLTDMSREQLEDAESRRAMEIITFTTNLENVGDAIDKSLLDAALKKIKKRKMFSVEGMAELRRMHAYVLDTARLALTVFMDREVDAARLLLERKEAFRNLEREGTDAHLDRLRGGRVESVETSALHLDILRDLKRINSHLSSIAYPILDAAGQLRKTRLKKSADRDESPAA